MKIMSLKVFCGFHPLQVHVDLGLQCACRYCCDRKSRAACAQSFAPWQQATIEFTCHDHSLRTLVATFNGSQVNIGRASTPRSLFYCLFAPHVSMLLFFTYIPFVVNHTINATPPEKLQQYSTSMSS